MSKVRYKTPSFQKTYDAMLAAAQNPAGELYYDGRPHRGSGHRTAFWDGYAGLEHSANVVPGTLSAVCFAAGKAFAKTNPGINPKDAVWTPNVTRQGESIKQEEIVVTEQGKSAKTIAQRQADLRQRRADEGLTEVRGIYAKPEHHSKIKTFAKTLLKKKVSAVKAAPGWRRRTSWLRLERKSRRNTAMKRANFG